MPGGDRTGPNGQGPMTGRQAGLCRGFNGPAGQNFGAGRGLGRGMGRGLGYGMGRGMAFPQAQETDPMAEIVKRLDALEHKQK